MATVLLAKKLTNQITSAAEQAGISLSCDLSNFYTNDGDRLSAGCEGVIMNHATKAEVYILTSESCPDDVRIECTRNPYDERPVELHRVHNHVAVQKIIELLTPPLISHENLSASRITNLPNLADNLLLALYLCDSATCTQAWAMGLEKLKHTINSHGFSQGDLTQYPPSYDDKSFEVANVLWSNLAGSHIEPHMVAHHLLTYHDVRLSDSVKGRLAYYQDDRKRAAGIRTPIKVRKYLQKFFGKFRTPETLEYIARLLDEKVQGTDEYDVRIYNDGGIDGWADAYHHITSCMSTQTKAYGVGELDTYRCYCTSAMTDGAESSGLSLVVLYQDDKPVARSITYTSSRGEDCYVRNYGDDRLVRWLSERGYAHKKQLPRGTRLWTECHDKCNAEYLSPYVDGNAHDACATLEFVDGQPYWVISDKGVELQNCCGYTRENPSTCDHCDDPISEGYEYTYPDLNGNYVTLCSCCADHHSIYVNDSTVVYVDEGDLAGIIATNQGYYTHEYLDDRDWVVTGDGDVMDWCDVDLCVRSDDYYSLAAFVDISTEPTYVKETWAGYINENGLVYEYFYTQYGVYINELDTSVHEDHVDGVMAYLASEQTSESEA